ncbi:MAG: ATP-binding protein [Gemmatimonadota bacterium]
MSVSADCPLAEILAERLRAAREVLVERWLERIAARVDLNPNRIFPSEELLDHVPLLIDGMASYLEDPAEEVSADAPVVAKAMELGAMRHEQGFEVYEVLKEYELLGGILFHFLTSIVDEIEQPCSRSELLACAHRLFRSITIIQAATTVRYMRLEHAAVAERESRLRGFNRALSHEVRNQIGALSGAIAMLGEDFVLKSDTMRQRFHSMAVENVQGMERTTTNLIELSRLDVEARHQRNVLLREAAFESVRQLRHSAEARGVRVHVSDDLPRIEVPASAVELALTNYVSNAIKYHDPGKEDRWVEVRGWEQPHPTTGRREVVVAVADNGLGVPAGAREHLFGRFFRAHADTATGVEGTGLGLSLVREMMDSVGGRAWADFEREGETIFAFALPARRAADLARAEQEPTSTP